MVKTDQCCFAEQLALFIWTKWIHCLVHTKFYLNSLIVFVYKILEISLVFLLFFYYKEYKSLYGYIINPWMIYSIFLLLCSKVRNVIILLFILFLLSYMLLPVLFGINYQIFVIHSKSLFYYHKMHFEVFYMNYFKQISSWHHMLCLWCHNNFFETNMVSLKNFFKKS